MFPLSYMQPHQQQDIGNCSQTQKNESNKEVRSNSIDCLTPLSQCISELLVKFRNHPQIIICYLSIVNCTRWRDDLNCAVTEVERIIKQSLQCRRQLSIKHIVLVLRYDISKKGCVIKILLVKVVFGLEETSIGKLINISTVGIEYTLQVYHHCPVTSHHTITFILHL